MLLASSEFFLLFTFFSTISLPACHQNGRLMMKRNVKKEKSLMKRGNVFVIPQNLAEVKRYYQYHILKLQFHRIHYQTQKPSVTGPSQCKKIGTQQSQIKVHIEARYSTLDPTLRNKLQFRPIYIPILQKRVPNSNSIL